MTSVPLAVGPDVAGGSEGLETNAVAESLSAKGVCPGGSTNSSDEPRDEAGSGFVPDWAEGATDEVGSNVSHDASSDAENPVLPGPASGICGQS
jgi:hypothetical protein